MSSTETQIEFSNRKVLLHGWGRKKGCVHLLRSLRIQGHREAFGIYILALKGTGKATPGFAVFFV